MTADSLQRVLFAVGSYHLNPLAPPMPGCAESGWSVEVEFEADIEDSMVAPRPFSKFKKKRLPPGGILPAAIDPVLVGNRGR